MRNWIPSLGLALLLSASWITDSYADEAAVRKALESYLQCFNDADAEAAIAYWDEQAVHHDRETGERTEGREAIAADLREALDPSLRSRLTGDIQQFQLITPEVAKIEGEVLLSQADIEPVRSVYSAIMILKNGDWKFHSIEESPVPIPSDGHEALEKLSWLVGRWQDVGDEQTVETKVDWSPGSNFLIRSYVITEDGEQTEQGTQVIGWDPREQQIRSWSFNSDGSFGDGIWSESGDHWLVRSSQTLADGQAASGTYVITPEDDDAVGIRLIGHEIEGEPQPSREEVVARRIDDAMPEVASNQTEPNAEPADANVATQTEAKQ